MWRSWSDSSRNSPTGGIDELLVGAMRHVLLFAFQQSGSHHLSALHVKAIEVPNTWYWAWAYQSHSGATASVRQHNATACWKCVRHRELRKPAFYFLRHSPREPISGIDQSWGLTIASAATRFLSKLVHSRMLLSTKINQMRCFSHVQ